MDGRSGKGGGGCACSGHSRGWRGSAARCAGGGGEFGALAAWGGRLLAGLVVRGRGLLCLFPEGGGSGGEWAGWLASLAVGVALRARWEVWVSFGEESGAPVVLPAVFAVRCGAFGFCSVQLPPQTAMHLTTIDYKSYKRQMKSEQSLADYMIRTLKLCQRQIYCRLIFPPHRSTTPSIQETGSTPRSSKEGTGPATTGGTIPSLADYTCCIQGCRTHKCINDDCSPGGNWMGALTSPLCARMIEPFSRCKGSTTDMAAPSDGTYFIQSFRSTALPASYERTCMFRTDRGFVVTRVVRCCLPTGHECVRQCV